LQVRSPVETKEIDRPFGSVFHDQSNALGIDHIDVERVIDGIRQLRERKRLQQA
jgi:hypothetical protein